MNRRAFLASASASAAAGLVPAALSAQPVPSADVLARYMRRLQDRIADGAGGRYLLDVEQELAALHGTHRAGLGLAPLAPHPGLAAAARAHAADQIVRRFFAHASPEGFQVDHRVGLLARSFVGLPGENLVEQRGRWRPPTAAVLMQQWLESPGHKANIEKASYTHVGLAALQGGTRTLAVAVFGERFGELPEPVPFELGAGEAVGRLLSQADPPMSGYNLTPVGGRGLIGPFGSGDSPRGLIPGAYVLRPRIALGDGRFTVVYGPILAA